jgi:hypothetical protein
MESTQITIELLDPTSGTVATKGAVSPRLDTLSGKTLGVIWNGRLPGDLILNRMIEILKERYTIKEVVFREKPYIGNVAPDEIFDEIAARCDAVVSGVGD